MVKISDLKSPSADLSDALKRAQTNAVSGVGQDIFRVLGPSYPDAVKPGGVAGLLGPSYADTVKASGVAGLLGPSYADMMKTGGAVAPREIPCRDAASKNTDAQHNRATLQSPAGVVTPTSARLSAVGDIGKLVRTRRKALGLSQQELADSAGVGRRFVSELENGKDSIELGRVIAVCAAVGVDLFARLR